MEDPVTGRVEALWIKRAIRGPMDLVDEATLITGEGIDGDANRGRSQRQVTVIEAEVFNRIRERLPNAAPEMRRANIMVSGIPLAESRCQVLQVANLSIHIRGRRVPASVWTSSAMA